MDSHDSIDGILTDRVALTSYAGCGWDGLAWFLMKPWVTHTRVLGTYTLGDGPLRRTALDTTL